MSALAMILTAAMAVPADGRGPEMVSAEMEQGLDLRGQWEGILLQSCDDAHEIRLDVTGRGAITCDLQFQTWCGWKTKALFTLKDEGGRRLRIEKIAEALIFGTYRQQADWIVVVCPSFGLIVGEKDQYLLILHRVKPRK